MKSVVNCVILYDVEDRWILKGQGEKALELACRSGEGGPRRTIRPVLTVQEICRLLKKSRRQVYRYLKAGRLRPCARVLGLWLFSQEEAARFRQRRVPASLKRFFWDAQLSDLSPDHHRDFILGRLLE